MKGAYWRERTLTRRLFRWIRYGEGGRKEDQRRHGRYVQEREKILCGSV